MYRLIFKTYGVIYNKIKIIVFQNIQNSLCFEITNKGTLREKCPNTEVFLVRIQEITDQKKLRIWTLFTQWKSQNAQNFKRKNKF